LGALKTLSVYRTAANQLRTVRILSVKGETSTIKSFTFRDKCASRASPGQFVMVWVPGVDEVPMSLSTINPNDGLAAITVEKLGEATSALHKMRVGDVVGIRGPFGNGYALTKVRSVMIVGGGTGLASLAPLTEKMLTETRRRVAFLLGAKNCDELPSLERMKSALSRANGELIVTTEDGSYGVKGLVTQQAEKLLATERFDVVYACGPEQMMYKMFLLAERYGMPFQASLERFMRCAVGLCGTCVVGRFRVCRDGPVFSGDQLREVKGEFGQFRRGFNGSKIGL
jgi:dihydroorotate dehydrogenase electron transfer subunit